MERIHTSHYVCLNCRRAVKLPFRVGANPADNFRLPCAICERDMYSVSSLFTPPRKKDDKQWKKLEWMIANGWRGYYWPTRPKMSLREVKSSITESKIKQAKLRNMEKESRALENARKVAKYNFVRSKTANKRALKEIRKQEEYQNSVMKDLGLE